MVARIVEAHRQAAKRRAWAKKDEQEERKQGEKRAYWHAYVRGLGKRRRDLMVH